jgi:hypothetical protein
VTPTVPLRRRRHRFYSRSDPLRRAPRTSPKEKAVAFFFVNRQFPFCFPIRARRQPNRGSSHSKGSTLPTMYAENPVSAFLHRLDGVRGTPPKVRATCPSCHRKGALSVGEGRDGAALAKCFAGCPLADITHALRLDVKDLFPARDREALRQRDAVRSAYRATPRQAIKGALAIELAKTRERLRAEHGYERPLRAADHDAARLRVARLFGLPKPALVPAFSWEVPPFDDDPSWPALYTRALDETMRDRWQAFRPEAEPWEVDPSGPNLFDRMAAETLARRWLRALTA